MMLLSAWDRMIRKEGDKLEGQIEECAPALPLSGIAYVLGGDS